MHLPPTMTTSILLLVVQSSYALSAKPMKAAIIGGGLGGLTCCNALRKIGVDAHVFERAEKLSPQAGTGLTLWPNGLSAIEAIDPAAIPEILRSGSATVDIEVTSADGLTKLPNPTGDPTRFTTVYGQPMINIRWSKLQQCLAARLPADCIHLGSKLSHVDVETATAHFETPTGGTHSESFDLIIGADGINSALRAQLVGDGAPRDAGRTIWRSIIPYDEALLTRGGCTMSAGQGKVGFLTHIGESDLYWSAFATDEAISESALDRSSYADVKAYLLEQFADVYKVKACIERTPAEAILERRVADRIPLVDTSGRAAIPWKGPVTLLGDAFHAMIPSLGQGANSSFEGAYRLAAALRGATTSDEVCAALRAYEVNQMERAHWIVERSAAQGKTVYEDRDEFMRKQQEAQDTMWGIRFDPLAA
jgi:2-polyprenyl-6-methoxyphenol hydroxylase-like FAD-dependent oxidoreductase